LAASLAGPEPFAPDEGRPERGERLVPRLALDLLADRLGDQEALGVNRQEIARDKITIARKPVAPKQVASPAPSARLLIAVVLNFL
jgi:hypothetical protein